MLPVLRELNVPATFFLSGRSLHGLGPYWWEVLEARIRRRAPAGWPRRSTSRRRPRQRSPEPARTTRPPRRALEADAGTPSDQLSAADIAALGEAGMTIGFHTVRHDVLPASKPAIGSGR